jgi:hypothetical protein
MCTAALLLGTVVAFATATSARAGEREDFIAAYRADSGGSYAEASTLYRKVLLTKPHCDECYWNMAVGADKLGRSSEAEHH